MPGRQTFPGTFQKVRGHLAAVLTASTAALRYTNQKTLLRWSKSRRTAVDHEIQRTAGIWTSRVLRHIRAGKLA